MSCKSKTMHLSLSKKLHRSHNCPVKKEPILKEIMGPESSCCLTKQVVSYSSFLPASTIVIEAEGEGDLETKLRGLVLLSLKSNDV